MIDTKRSLQVFLCHASGDKPAVIKLHRQLVKDGVDAWLDKEKLIPGQDWQTEIPKAVKNSDIVIVCLSSKSVTKEGFIQKEIKIALDAADEKPDGTIFIIPARLDNCKIPERIGKFQWVDLFLDEGYQRLMKALKLRAASLGISIKRNKKIPKTLIEDSEKVIETPKIPPYVSKFMRRLKLLKRDFDEDVRFHYPNRTVGALLTYGAYPGEVAFHDWRDRYIIFLAEYNLTGEIKKYIENTKQKPNMLTALNSSAHEAFEGAWGQFTDMEIDRLMLLAKNGLLDEYLNPQLPKDKKRI